MRFERRPEKTYHKKPLWGKNVQEIWVRTKAQAPSALKPILWRLYKNEIRTADPSTRLDSWYLKKKELNKETKNETKRTRLVLKLRWQPRVKPGMSLACTDFQRPFRWNTITGTTVSRHSPSTGTQRVRPAQWKGQPQCPSNHAWKLLSKCCK